MDVCSSGHDEIVYDARYCPMCNLMDEYKGEIDSLTKEISQLESQVNEMST